MTWAAVTEACAAFLGAFTGVAFLAVFRPAPPPPRHPGAAVFPVDEPYPPRTVADEDDEEERWRNWDFGTHEGS